MKSYNAERASVVWSRVAAFFLLVFVASVSVNAQRGVPVPATGRPSEPNTRVPGAHEAPGRPPSVREREFTLRRMEEEAKRPPTPEEQQLAMQQIAEDYKQIQEVNNEMMSAAMKKGAALDYKSISDATAEIAKRAARLRTNIALPKPESPDEKIKKQKTETDEQIKASLLMLDRYLMSFVGSPLFTNTSVLDAKAAAKAGQDLANVIELSELVSKGTGKLVFARPAKQ